MEIRSKNCSKCKQTKPFGDFYNSSSSKDGKKPSCKACAKKYNQSPEVKKASQERQVRYREKNRDNIRERTARWLEENSEHRKEYRKKYYEENKEKILNLNKKYSESHKEEMAGYKAKWYLNNLDRTKRSARDWALSNPLKVSATKIRHRAKKRGAFSDISDKELSLILDYFDGGCALSGSKENLTFDHVIPLDSGNVGSVKGNIIPLRNNINSSKNNRNIFEWFIKYGDSLNLDASKFERLVAFLAKENGMSVEEYRNYYYSFFEKAEENDGIK